MEAPQKIRVCKFTDGDYIQRMEGSITFGNPVLIENILEETDPAIEPVLLKQTFKKGNTVMLKLGDAILEYSKDFKLYLTTKLRNPHYLPEVAVKVTLLNFMITIVGLQDQLLNVVVQKERPELAEEKARLVVEGAENKGQLVDTENKILHVLQTSQGNILEDESAINVLSSSKALANKIAAKQEIAEKTEVQIDEARQGYVPVAYNGSILFFCIADLANIDPMYQYSLPFFNGLFLTVFGKAEASDDLDQRIENLNDTFRYTLYCNICRSLFEKHKTLFSFLLCMRGLLANDQADNTDYRFLLTGGVSLEDPPPKPASWVPERCWGELFRLNKMGGKYAGFHDKFAKDIDAWKDIYDNVAPMKIIKDPTTRPAQMEGLDELQDILVLRCIRPDRVVPAAMDFITSKLGVKFVTPPPFDLQGSYMDSNALSPLIFVLSPGADPGSALYKFAAEKGREVAGISLGQGQGPKAEKLMDLASEEGTWVLLQNCHLATTWMPRLERLMEEWDPKKINRDFRLWLTSYPSAKFPVAILQNGVKMTNEAPKGLRANMTGSYYMDPISTEEFFTSCKCDLAFKRLCFNLCFFHAVCQERRLYGPLGWNIRYEFTENDLRISVMQLVMFLDEYPDELPLKALNYLTGECNYGGRVTEAMDRRLIAVLLATYYCQDACNDDFTLFEPLDDSPKFAPPPPGDYESHLEHIASLPLVSPPGVFGFNDNASLTKDMGETYTMMTELLSTVGVSGGGGGQSPDVVVGEIAKDVLNRVPSPFNTAKVQLKYPTLYEESMNTVLVQELTRFNGLIKAIRGTLQDIQKAVKGLLLMSADLEGCFFQMFDGQTPEMWLKYSYPSLKPLGGYVNDLVERLKFFQTWIDDGAPVMFWFSGIYFQQAFTTGASQNFARKYQLPIDTLSFDFFYPKEQEQFQKPADGVYTYGVFFEACKWDWDKWEIAESDPKVLFVGVPMLHLMPCEKVKASEFPHYDCPCYKVSTRKGILSTTGHSTNFVMSIKIPSSGAREHWIRRGVAMLTTLDT
jgi:dynein heavy chain